MDKLFTRLSRIFGPDRLLTDPARLEEVVWDALGPGRLHPNRRPEPARPLCVVLPSSPEEVREVVRASNEEAVPIIPYGGGSGLMGGALSIRPGIVMDLRKMDKILEIDPDSRSARIQSGVVLETLHRRLKEKGFILGHDPWTLPVATVGGAISTNSLGYRGGKYGSIGDQVLGLEAVLPNGQLVTGRAVPKSSVGLELKHLFIGTEGCFGIITEATLRIFPRPERHSFLGFGFSTFEAGFHAVQKIALSGLKPSLLDYGDQGSESENSVLYLGFEGTREMVEVEERLALSICRSKGVSLPTEEAERFWRERHQVARHFMQNRHQRRERRNDGTLNDWIHVALPASRILTFRTEAMEILSARRVCLKESGLWTQPELFSMRLSIEDRAGKGLMILENTVEELIRLAQKAGGSMEYCHGIGIKLAPFMAEEHGYGLEAMRRIKEALDPNRVMNPGKLGL
jgi:alkyldihydroxyacetonephosphate synthase